MNALRIHLNEFLVSLLLIAAVLLLVGAPQIAAQGPVTGCSGQGAVNADCKSQQPGNVNPANGAYFSKALSVKQKGGYVAHGVGMRNTGYGTIKISDVPAGSTVSKAYLFWALIGPEKVPGYSYNKGYLNGSSVTGSLVGTAPEPCWGFDLIWSYRADVTGKMISGGNGTYKLTGFASYLTDGIDPWSAKNIVPMFEGASLVILYRNNSYPNTLIQVYNGAATSWWGNELHLNMPGINTVAPTGFAYTTFIGADGETDAGKVGSKFFTTTLPTVAWEGSDPNGAVNPDGTTKNYIFGNLWDTMTVDLHSLVDAPEPDLWVTSQGGEDCITWTAQVVSYSNGNQDTDGDKLLDGWELNGYYKPHYGYDLVDLPGMGANPLHKDIFVEADYMPGRLPNKAHLDDIVSVFNNAPLTNPDGTTGIHIHIDTGGATNSGYAAAYDLGGGNVIPDQTHLGDDTPGCASYDWSAFLLIKNGDVNNPKVIPNFNPGRAPAFHYMIFADQLSPCMGTTSGISRNGSPDSVFITGATDFIVSLGGWPGGGSQNEREGTFVHELGHNLGLRNGGNDQVNYKPNYLSVMNLFFQTTGVYRDSSWGHFDYSRSLLTSLNENALIEVYGLGSLAATYGTKWYCPNGSVATDTTADSNVDWDCNGNNIQTSVKVNINGDTTSSGAPFYSTLGTQNNWASIAFQGGGVIGTGVQYAGLSNPLGITYWVNELTYEQAQNLGVVK